MTKRIMSLIMTLVMVLSCFPAVSLSTAAQMWEAAEESLAEKETQVAAETVQTRPSEQETSAPETKKSATRAATSGTTGDCKWSVSGTTLTISGSGKMADYSDYTSVPWGQSITQVIIGNGVTRIGAVAFSNCTSLTQVTIPTSVKSIGSYAYYACALQSISFPSNLQ